jgi:Asp-tRNA(Asn)/Glu-tRNA(Gln) amidotransferase A subunit family amidase
MHALPATLTELQQAIAGGRVSAEQAWQIQRQNRDALNARWHCLSSPVTGSEADAGHSGPLAGIGLAHKDNFDTWGRRPGCGVDGGHPQPGLPAAWAIEQLRQAGAGHLGALVMAEHACGATSANAHFERCINPLHPDAVVGGSSSGSAVAVAGGLAYGALGTDTAGSVRIPAATCGLVGLKTTHGLIPTQGLAALAPSLDTIGVLTRNVQDAGALLGPLAPHLPTAIAPTAPRWRAWIPDDWVHTEVAQALHTLAQELGAERIDLQADHHHLSCLADIVLHAEVAALRREPLLKGQLSPAVQALALPGLVMPAHWSRAALAVRGTELQRFCQTQLPAASVILMPALPAPVPDWQTVHPGQTGFIARELLALHRCMGFINYLGLPSLVLPIARDSRGLPISVQLVGRPFHERELLALAGQLQQRRFGSAGFKPGWHLPASES